MRAIAFSTDGKTLAPASEDGIVRLRDPTTGWCLQALEGQNLLWLLPEYRATTCTTVYNDMLALGYPSGQVIVLEFALF